MFDAGMKSLPALRVYSVSPLVGSTMRIPQCAFKNSGASVNESIIARNAALLPPDPVAGDGVAIGDRQAQPAARAIMSDRTTFMHPLEAGAQKNTARAAGAASCYEPAPANCSAIAK